MTTYEDRLVVRPRPWKLALYAFGALVFVVAGVLLMWSGSISEFVIGALTVAFFGGVGVLVVLSAVKRGTSQLTLTRAGIELGTGGTIPWADVESVEVVRRPTTMVAVRLRDHDRYLASWPDQREANRMIGFLRLFAHVFRAVPSMRRFTDVRGQADQLRWNRETYGFDLGFSPAWLDRSPHAFAELLERYRQGQDG